MKEIRNSELLATMLEMQRWLEAIGAPSRPEDRFAATLNVVRRSNDGAEFERKTGRLLTIGHIDNYLYGLADALDFIQVFKAFRDERSATLADKLRIALQGPFHFRRENAKNNIARNTLFELSLASEWRLRGAKVAIGEPDISIEISGRPFAVECKRPLRPDGIRTSLTLANRQLRDKLNFGHFEFGIIALSLSRMIHCGDCILVAPSFAETAFLSKLMDDFHTNNQDRWSTVTFDERVAGIVEHLALPTQVLSVPGKHLSLFSQLISWPVHGHSPGYEFLGNEMAALYTQMFVAC